MSLDKTVEPGTIEVQGRKLLLTDNLGHDVQAILGILDNSGTIESLERSSKEAQEVIDSRNKIIENLPDSFAMESVLEYHKGIIDEKLKLITHNDLKLKLLKNIGAMAGDVKRFNSLLLTKLIKRI